MNKMNATEIAVKKAEELRTVEILLILEKCKTLEDLESAKETIKAMLSHN